MMETYTYDETVAIALAAMVHIHRDKVFSILDGEELGELTLLMEKYSYLDNVTVRDLLLLLLKTHRELRV